MLTAGFETIGSTLEDSRRPIVRDSEAIADSSQHTKFTENDRGQDRAGKNLILIASCHGGYKELNEQP